MTDDLPTPADRLDEHSDTPGPTPAPSQDPEDLPAEPAAAPAPETSAEEDIEEPTPITVDEGADLGQDEVEEGFEDIEDQEAGEEDLPEGEAEAGEQEPPPPPPSNKRWYVVKVQSGREESIKDAIERRVKIEGLEEYFGQIIIPVERIPEIRRGKRIEKEHKLYPGYLMVEVEFNDRILYLFRETTGVGDFVGGGVGRAPSPMSEREVERMLARHTSGQPDLDVGPKLKIKPRFSKGDRLRVREGAFSGMEGEVVEILEDRGKVKLELTIIGRTVPVELEYYEVEPV